MNNNNDILPELRVTTNSANLHRFFIEDIDDTRFANVYCIIVTVYKSLYDSNKKVTDSFYYPLRQVREGNHFCELVQKMLREYISDFNRVKMQYRTGRVLILDQEDFYSAILKHARDLSSMEFEVDILDI